MAALNRNNIIAAGHRVEDQSWLTRYQQLLASSGLEANEVLVSAQDTQARAENSVLSLYELLCDPTLLENEIIKSASQMPSPRTLKAMVTVLHQDLALSVFAPLTLQLFRDGEAPLADPRRIFLKPAQTHGETAPQRWFQVPGGDAVEPEEFLYRMGRITTEWYSPFRKGLGVSPGAYWSSTGLGLCAPFSALWNRSPPQDLCDLAQAWLVAFNNEACRFIDWIPAEFGGQLCAIPQRRGCCLKYLLPDGGYCGTCGIYRKQRLS